MAPALTEPGRERVCELERAARAGVQRVMDLARGLGASTAAERQAQALQAAELARQEQAQKAATQQQRDEARLQTAVQKQTPADAQRNVNHSRPRTGPRMG